MSDKDQYDKMIEALCALTKNWHRAGIPPTDIVIFLLKAAADTTEYAGVKYEIAQAIVAHAYGKDNLLRPNAKA